MAKDEVNPEDAEDGPVLGAGPMPSPTVEDLEPRLGVDVNVAGVVQDEEAGEFDDDDKIAEAQRDLQKSLQTVYPTGYEQPELQLTEDPQVVPAGSSRSSSKDEDSKDKSSRS